MDTRLRDALISAVTEVVENTTFMEVVLADGASCEPPEKPRIEVTLPIIKPMKAVLILRSTKEFVALLAEAVFAGEPANDQMQRDFFMELGNTIAGSLMRELTDEEQTFELGLPTIAELKGACPEDEHICFTIDNHCFNAVVRAESEV